MKKQKIIICFYYFNLAKKCANNETKKNQRIKECNRIKVVVDNLKKIGVKSVETKTGLVIVGNPNMFIIFLKFSLLCIYL